MRDACEVMAALSASGLTAEQNALVMELCASLGRPVRSARQERNARYYQARKERLNQDASDETKTIKTVSDGGAPPPTQPNSLGSKPNPPCSPPTGAHSPTTGRRKSGCSLPDDWQPKPQHFARAAAGGQGADFVNRCAGVMRNWAGANRNRAVARKADWDLTFDGWLDREIEKLAARAPPNGAQQSFRVVNGNQGARHANGKRVSAYSGSLAEAARDSLAEDLMRSNEGEGIHPDIGRRLSFVGRG